MTIYLVHHTDQDGYGSAAIARLFFQQHEQTVQLYPYNYTNTDKLPDFTNKDVVFVDCGIQPFSKMKSLVIDKCKSLIWIDHHPDNVTAVKKAKLGNKKNIHLYLSTERCATYLTWQYFNKNKSVPLAVNLIDDYDRGVLLYKDLSVPFCFMINLLDKAKNIDTDFWNNIFKADISIPNNILTSIIRKGKVVQFVYRKEYEEAVENGSVINFEGYNTLVINSELKTILFSVYPSLYKFDIYMSWYCTNNIVSVSLFSYNVNVGKIAAKYGGGGHERAAGFSMSLDKWTKLLTKLIAKNK